MMEFGMKKVHLCWFMYHHPGGKLILHTRYILLPSLDFYILYDKLKLTDANKKHKSVNQHYALRQQKPKSVRLKLKMKEKQKSLKKQDNFSFLCCLKNYPLCRI